MRPLPADRAALPKVLEDEAVRLRRYRIAAFCLTLILLLAACQPTPAPPASGADGGSGTQTADGGEDDAPRGDGPVTGPGESLVEADDLFTVTYSPSGSMNPLTGSDYYNEQLTGLLYEGLFALNGELAPEPVLCESFVTGDGVNYELKLREGVRFHDGSLMDTDDVTYSLNIARGSAKFAARLEDIASVGVADEMTVSIRLKEANYMLPSLLDVPIIKNGQADEPEPAGTGPYMRRGDTLKVFTSHRDYAPGALKTIHLKAVDAGDLSDAFSDRTIDLVSIDPTGNAKFNVHMVHETRYYDTTDLLYLGFNCSYGPASDNYVRQALTRLVDLDAISSDMYGNAARKSVFLLSPVLGCSDGTDEAGYGYSRQNFNRLAVSAGLEDVDYDGFLEHNGEKMALRLIVNSETTKKVEAAQRIVAEMQNLGVNAVLETLSFSDFQKALSDGNFDMYLAEARLKADFDLGSILYGDLNYSGRSNGDYRELMTAFLSAPDAESRAAAGLKLDLFAAEDAMLAPIAYKRRSVVTHVGTVTGLTPSQTSVYCGVLNWTVDPDA